MCTRLSGQHCSNGSRLGTATQPSLGIEGLGAKARVGQLCSRRGVSRENRAQGCVHTHVVTKAAGALVRRVLAHSLRGTPEAAAGDASCILDTVNTASPERSKVTTLRTNRSPA